MSWMEIELEGGRTAFRPGEEVAGRVLWLIEEEAEGSDGPSPVESAEVRLVWFTRGRGDRDSSIVAAENLLRPEAADRRTFRLPLPAGPYSVSGKLLSVVWAVEAVLEPGSRAARTEIVVSPTGREVLLHPELGGSEAAASVDQAPTSTGDRTREPRGSGDRPPRLDAEVDEIDYDFGGDR